LLAKDEHQTSKHDLKEYECLPLAFANGLDEPVACLNSAEPPMKDCAPWAKFTSKEILERTPATTFLAVAKYIFRTWGRIGDSSVFLVSNYD